MIINRCILLLIVVIILTFGYIFFRLYQFKTNPPPKHYIGKISDIQYKGVSEGGIFGGSNYITILKMENGSIYVLKGAVSIHKDDKPFIVNKHICFDENSCHLIGR